jgi:hypothetical protein
MRHANLALLSLRGNKKLGLKVLLGFTNWFEIANPSKAGVSPFKPSSAGFS